MKFVPHEYQKFAIQHILDHPISALFLEAGLGKTSTTLTAIYELCLNRFEIGKVLVVAPLRVARNTWPDEISKWDHLKGLSYELVVGSAQQRLEALKRPATVYIVNRENVDWLINRSGVKFVPDMLVIDEASSFKSHQSLRFKALMKIRPKVKRVVALTATPAANSLMDLWAEFRILDMGERLGRYIGRFREEYFLPDKRNGSQIYSWKPMDSSKDRIYKKISDITISMESGEYLQMPERIDNIVEVQLTPAEDRAYTRMKTDMVINLHGKEIDAVNAAALSSKLLQMANGAVYDENHQVIHIHGHKLDATEDLVEAQNGKPCLIAYWYRHDLEALKERFPGLRELKSSQDISDWNNGKIQVAAIHPASAGHGLNLQSGGSTLIWYGLTWSLELYQQTNARLYRQGQKHTVVIHHIIARGTIDEDVMKALQRKDADQAELLRAVKARLNLRKESA